MKRLTLLLSSLALITTTGALADPKHGHGDSKHAHQGGPPGLAGKPHGMPPGQAKKMWRHGEYVPRTYYSQTRYFVMEPQRYQLHPAPPGYRWILVEDDAYLVRRDDGLVMDLVVNALANLIR